MKILVLNSGSSSLKFKLYDMPKKDILAQGLLERIGQEDSAFHIIYDKKSLNRQVSIKNHKEALSLISKKLLELGIIESFEGLGGVGHRVVHGGEAFSRPVIIDDEVLKSIRKLIALAPLHNPANILGIEAVKHLAPNLPQVAVFDTAFHQSMPPEAYRYAVPKSWYSKYNVRRYGFHGTSHYYVMCELSKLTATPIQEINAVTLHLGNGASVCAIKGGKSIDTSMGLTPLEGLVMGTRSGDIDPGIHLYMNRYANLPLEKIDWQLNHESGLLGIAGTQDMRKIQERMDRGDSSAKLAFDISIWRLVKYVGAYAALLGSLDALVFTGGIGENSARVRQALCERLGIFGVDIDSKANEASKSGARSIHTPKSQVQIWVIPTDEESVIAKESYDLIKKERSCDN